MAGPPPRASPLLRALQQRCGMIIFISASPLQILAKNFSNFAKATDRFGEGTGNQSRDVK